MFELYYHLAAATIKSGCQSLYIIVAILHSSNRPLFVVVWMLAKRTQNERCVFVYAITDSFHDEVNIYSSFFIHSLFSEIQILQYIYTLRYK